LAEKALRLHRRREGLLFSIAVADLSFRKPMYRAAGYFRNVGVTVFPSFNAGAGDGVAIEPKAWVQVVCLSQVLPNTKQ